MTFVPPPLPTHETSQLDTTSFIAARSRARRSNDPDVVAWYLGFTDNVYLQEQFEIARCRINALMSSGWANLGNYSQLRDLLAKDPVIKERFDSDPSRFNAVPFMIDNERRYFLLEAPTL